MTLVLTLGSLPLYLSLCVVRSTEPSLFEPRHVVVPRYHPPQCDGQCHRYVRRAPWHHAGQQELGPPPGAVLFFRLIAQPTLVGAQELECFRLGQTPQLGTCCTQRISWSVFAKGVGALRALERLGSALLLAQGTHITTKRQCIVASFGHVPK